MLSSQYGIGDYGSFQHLSLLLLAEGRLAEREGRPGDAARSYLDCLRLGVAGTRGTGLSLAAFALQIQRRGLMPLQELAERLDAPTAADAARAMARLDAGAPTLADALTVERDLVTLQMLQAFQEPDGWRQFAPLFVPGSNLEELSRGRAALARLQWGLMKKRPIIDGMRRYLSALIVDARGPYYAGSGAPPFPTDRLSPWLLPGPGPFSQNRREWALRDAWWRVTAALLAEQAYREQHGSPPASLNALVPVYLPRLPADPFASRPLCYRLRGARAYIYSRGPDGDDDGGRDLGISVLPGPGRFWPSTDGDLASLTGMTEDGR
jgi:hypothetical protein